MLWQSPAVDVVGIGTAKGLIVIHNIRLDETLMNFTQDWGPISSLAFRTGKRQVHFIDHATVVVSCLQTLFYSLPDGPPIMASCSPQGHIAFWDLERCQLVAQQRHAHSTAVAAATFLHGEPLLVTNGADNAIKVTPTDWSRRNVKTWMENLTLCVFFIQVWIFDQEGGGARLLRSRRGHSAPPTTICHYGNDGKHILSAGN